MTGVTSASAESARRWRRHLGLVVALVAVIGAAAVGFRADATTSVPAPGWSVTALTPTTNLADGQRVTINIKSNQDIFLTELEIRECRTGVTFTDQADSNPNSGKCPTQALSTSADLAVNRNTSANGLVQLTQSDEGATVSYAVGQGVVNWSTTGGPATITCDSANPCTFVVRLRVNGVYTFFTTPLTFVDADPIKACGGTATGVVNTGGSDELVDAWGSWTREYCGLPGSAGAPTRAAFSGEDLALKGLDSGDLDLAYSGAGYGSSAKLVDPALGTRATVAIPVAVNASVVATGGGYRQLVNGDPIGDKSPYPQNQLKARDAAALLGGGIGTFQRTDLPYAEEVLLLNPTLRNVPYWTGANVQASALTSTATWVMTSYINSFASADWLDRSVDPAVARGVTSSLGLATPNFLRTALTSGRPSLEKVTKPAAVSDPDGPLWVFTDRTTASALGLTPSALENGAGAEVAPTRESMYAAVASMKADGHGLLVPDVQATTPAAVTTADATTPYPLTYVVYAIVPAEPLVDTTTCTPRADSQTLLTKWLTYLTGAGQSNLPAGLEPIPTSLADQAKTALAKVGTSPVTGACAGKVNLPATTGGGGSAGATGGATAVQGTSVTAGTGVTSAIGTGLGVGGTTAPANAAAAAAAGEAAAAEKAKIAVPAFAVIAAASDMTTTIPIIANGAGAGAGTGTGATASAAPQLTPGRVASLAGLWALVAVAGVGLVVFQLGPILAQRDQRDLLLQYKTTISNAANESSGLAGVSTQTKPPELGSPVAILEVGALRSQQVVVEGVSTSETREGPGHVPGTAGLGQPGNSVVVAHRNAYGGAFAKLDHTRKNDRIVVTTTQGQSVYAVTSVNKATVDDGSSDGSSTTTTTAPSTTTTTAPGATTTTAPGATTTTGAGLATAKNAAATSAAKQTAASSKIISTSVDKLYGPTDDDRLTMVTSASRSPWNTNTAVVVKAKLLTEPFAPTPQGSRSASETGMHGDSGAWPTVVLSLLALVGVVVASILLYRKMKFRIAYVLTIAPLVVVTIISGEAIARLFPAWI